MKRHKGLLAPRGAGARAPPRGEGGGADARRQPHKEAAAPLVNAALLSVAQEAAANSGMAAPRVSDH